MIAFSVSHDGDSDADEHWGRDQHQDAAAQGLNNTLARASRLRIAQSAILGEEKARREERNEKAEHAGEPARFSLATAAHQHSLQQVCHSRGTRQVVPLVRKRFHVQQAEAVRPDHIHHD
jgi:hypothetical protein